MNNERSEIQHELTKGPCADCGFLSARWASLTRGVVICSDCYAQHTYLGPSISFCQFIESDFWDIEHLRLLLALHKSNANKIWENTVSDSKVRKPVYPQSGEITKVFVREKYLKQAFIPKLTTGENQDSLNSQLIACARSDFVNVTLRLLVLGANVNFQDEETGDTALHVAAREGNSNQVELLFLYGADLAIKNKHGFIAHQEAAESGNVTVQNQLIRLFFYFTDRFTYFLCKRKPDHSTGKHFYLPAMNLLKNPAFKNFDVCQAMMLNFSNSTMYELSQDFYDEINRRDNLAAWNTKVHVDNHTEPQLWFLPPNPMFSSARNQRRQKFGKMRLGALECFVYQMIKEQKRRTYGDPAPPAQNTPRRAETKVRSHMDRSECEDALPSCSPPVVHPMSEDEPLYDDIIDDKISLDDFLEIREKLAATENIVQTLTKKNENLTKIVHTLQSQNSNINAELFSLKEEINKINRNAAVTKRIPSPFGADSTERSIPISTGPQTFNRRPSEDRIDGTGGARWRSNSSDRRNSNDVRPVETRIETIVETTPTSRRNRDELNFIIQQGEHITKYIRVLIEKGNNGNNQRSTVDGLYGAVNILIQHLPDYVPDEKIQHMIDSLMQLSAKCRNPLSNPGEISEAAQMLADKLRLVLLDV